MAEHSSSTLFSHLFSGLTQHYEHVVTAVFVALVLLLGIGIVYRHVRNPQAGVVPGEKFSLQNVFDLFMEGLISMTDSIIGKGGRKYAPFVGTVFLFIFVANLIGMVPGFLAPTTNWSTGAAIAVIVFIAFNVFGFKVHGRGYFGHFFAPLKAKDLVPDTLTGPARTAVMALLAIPFFVCIQVLFLGIETISLAVRPVTLSIRLFLNISADHMVLGIFSGIAPYLLPLPFMILGLMVAFLQAFIFAMLTMVYISLAVAHEH